MEVMEGFDGPMKDWPEIRLIAGVDQMIPLLHKEWEIAIATNAMASNESDILAAFKRVELDEYIDRIYCFKSVGHLKPSAEFFDHVIKFSGVEKSKCIMIGDSYQNDILGANQSGIRGIWLNHQGLSPVETPECTTIRNFSELPETLARLIS